MSRLTDPGRKKVLVVEDDAGLRAVLAHLLEEDGLQVVSCANAHDALRRGAQDGLAVIVTDLRLPDRSGLELLSDFQKVNDSPVIIYTGHASLETAKQAVNAGAFAYVEKNANFDELLRHVHRAINQRLQRYTEHLEAQVAEAAQVVHDSQDRLSLALRTAGMGTWSLDTAHSSFVGSTELEAMMGFSPGQLPRSVRDLAAGIHPEDLAAGLKTARQVLAKGGAATAELRFKNPATQRWMWLEVRGERGANGLGGRLSGVAMDVTQRRSAEESLRKAREEFEAAVLERTASLNPSHSQLDPYRQRSLDEELQKQLSELAHVSRVYTMGELASGLAHELNQPLCAITNYVAACSAMIRKGAPDGDALCAALDEVGRQTARAGAVIRRMRDFVRWREPRRMSVGIGEIIREALQYIQTEANRLGILITVDVDPGLSPVSADTIQIVQVILNLLRNGLESMADTAPQRRRLTVKADVHDSTSVQVLIGDQGRGLSPEELDHVFEPVFTKGAGHIGLGLAISRAIVEAHEGRLWVQAEKEAGSTFGFTLPVHERLDQ